MLKQQRNAGRGLGVVQKAKSQASTLKKSFIPWLSLVLLVLLIVVPVSLFFWLLFYTDTFTVQGITVIDAREHTENNVIDLLSAETSKNNLGKNIFFVSTDHLEQKILNEIPQVKSAHATKRLPGTIKVVIQEKEAKLLLLSAGEYFLVDINGIPYEEARLELLPGTVLPIVKNNSEQVVRTGVTAIEPSFVDLIKTLQENLPDQVDADVAEIRIPSVAAEEVYFILTNNWEIRFDATRTAPSQLSILRRLLNEVIDEEIAGQLEYIDLRIPKRIYYKTISATPIDARTSLP